MLDDRILFLFLTIKKGGKNKVLANYTPSKHAVPISKDFSLPDEQDAPEPKN